MPKAKPPQVFWTLAKGKIFYPKIGGIYLMRHSARHRAAEFFAESASSKIDDEHAWQRARRNGWRLVKVRLVEVKK